MLLRANSVGRTQGLTKIHSRIDEEFRLRRGDFVGIVQPYENKYEFLVRDMRRERPTIHGIGVDFDHAVTAVTQLLDALTGKALRN